jgi:hypothetical protein
VASYRDITGYAGEDQSGGVLTFTNRLGVVTGRLSGQSGSPAGDMLVMIFPADQRLWVEESRRIRITRSRADGTFLLDDLPGGNYRLVAFSADPGVPDLADPDFLKRLLGVSVEISVASQGTTVQDLRIGRIGS